VARRPNYGFEKRQKQLEKQKKREEKEERKRQKREDGGDTVGIATAEELAELGLVVPGEDRPEEDDAPAA
jgi:hypothetical protein